MAKYIGSTDIFFTRIISTGGAGGGVIGPSWALQLAVVANMSLGIPNTGPFRITEIFIGGNPALFDFQLMKLTALNAGSTFSPAAFNNLPQAPATSATAQFKTAFTATDGTYDPASGVFSISTTGPFHWKAERGCEITYPGYGSGANFLGFGMWARSDTFTGVAKNIGFVIEEDY